jgi:hypothetical protein
LHFRQEHTLFSVLLRAEYTTNHIYIYNECITNIHLFLSYEYIKLFTIIKYNIYITYLCKTGIKKIIYIYNINSKALVIIIKTMNRLLCNLQTSNVKYKHIACI